jgi:hypothetical protein
MPWKKTTLAQFLKGATALAAMVAAWLNKKMAAIMILKGILQMFLSGIIDQINAIQSLIASLMAQGFYVILLSGSKGSWANRLRFAPNAPPEGTTEYCTTGVCVIATAPSFDASIQAFMSALNALKSGIPKPDFSKAVIKQKTMHAPPVVPKKGIETDVWKSLTLADLLPGLASSAADLADGLIGFIADLQHTIAQIAAFASSALALASAATGFVDELNNAGAFAIFLKPEAMGFVDRLEMEDDAPPRDVTLYSIGFCACFYAINKNVCDEKYKNLCDLFDEDIEYRPEHYPGAPISGYPETYYWEGASTTTPVNKNTKIKSWATPGAGYFKDEVYVTLHSNIASAKIYYTVNGADPRTTSSRLLFDPLHPIRITQNNSVVKHFAQYGSIIERRTRVEKYKIVMAIDPALPYSPKLGVVPGVGVIPGTNIADPTIPPNTNWGKQETDISLSVIGGDPDLDAQIKYGSYVPVHLGDPGNLIKNSANNVIGVAGEYTPPARVEVVYADDPDEVDTTGIILDLSPGTRVVSETGLKDVKTGATVTTLILDAGLSAKLIPPSFIAHYGALPWGSVSNFPDADANWVWNMGVPKSGSFPANLTVIFNAEWENLTAAPVDLVVYYMADNTAMFYFNDALVDTDSGWYPSQGTYVSSFQIPDGYRTVNVTVPAGQTATFRWSATNWGGAAGLIFSIKDSSGNVILNSANQEHVGASHPDWFLTNVVEKSDYSVPLSEVSVAVTLDVYYGRYARADVFSIVGSKIDKFGSQTTGGLTISDDKNALEGIIDFPGATEIPLVLVNGMKVNLMLVVHGVELSSTLTEYSPIAHDLQYKCGFMSQIHVKLSARNTELPLSDPTLNFLILDQPKYGKLIGSGMDFTYIPNPQFLDSPADTTVNPAAAKAGNREVLRYIARNIKANSTEATVTIDLI